MKKIHYNKVFDTDTATLVCQNGDDCLYRKNIGEYFIANEKLGTLELVTFNIAKGWAKDYMTAEAFKSEFEPKEDDGKRVVISASINAATVSKLRLMARQNGITVSRMIEYLVEKEAEE